MPACKLVDFELTIQGEHPPYAISARYNDIRQSGTLALAATDPGWQAAQRTLEDTTVTADAAAIVELGSRLFHALFQGGVRDLWVTARADLERERIDGLRVRLDIEPAAVAALPWEALVDPDRGTIFAADSQIALVRAATNYSRVAPSRRLRVALPVTVLIAAPTDPDNQIDSSREIAGTEQIVAALGAQRSQVKVMTGRFSITDLREELKQTRPAVLHFIGHGAPDGLWLWHRGQPYLVGPDSWRSVLQGARTVKLVLLNACSAGRSVGHDAFTGVAMKLLQVGVPAVIAMQAPIPDEAAINFAHSLYDELIAGECPGLVDLAVSAARSGLYATNPGDFSYGAPILWLNSPDGRIFDLTDGATPDTSELGAVKAIDLAAETTWLAHLPASVDVTRLPAEYHFVRAKWHNLLEELHSLLEQLRSLAAQPESPVFAAKIDDYRRAKAAALRLQRLIREAQAP